VCDRSYVRAAGIIGILYNLQTESVALFDTRCGCYGVIIRVAYSAGCMIGGFIMWDKVIQKSIAFWQSEKQCCILLSVIDGKFFVDVMFNDPPRIDMLIPVGNTEDSKETIAINISNYFRGV
jgi:hypothetical protein